MGLGLEMGLIGLVTASRRTVLSDEISGSIYRYE